MWTSGEIDFRFRLKLKITVVESTYPSQRPECPSLSPHFLLVCTQPRSQGLSCFVFGFTATSFPGSSLYLEKVPWLRLVTCLCMPTQAGQRVAGADPENSERGGRVSPPPPPPPRMKTSVLRRCSIQHCQRIREAK